VMLSLMSGGRERRKATLAGSGRFFCSDITHHYCCFLATVVREEENNCFAIIRRAVHRDKGGPVFQAISLHSFDQFASGPQFSR
jgi:hypothetical protein